MRECDRIVEEIVNRWASGTQDWNQSLDLGAKREVFYERRDDSERVKDGNARGGEDLDICYGTIS